MNYKNYITSVSEIEIAKLYRQFGIVAPSDLTIDTLSEIFNINVYFLKTESKLILDGDDVFIILNSRLTEREQLEDFYHELAHFLLDHRPTTTLSLFNYFEMKADNLIQYLAIPIHMFNFIDFESDYLIHEMAGQFNISWELAYKRLENIKQKVGA
ncbi:ImmA/IrrE family metallo-endopeptidase [Turicibacter sanguinis]|uniref:ImmA/IrrE family metallo-endopeptidase n=1 Tax=Turicibacter sanguinis TaxID=154288 RepID=UPI0018A88FBC|nr:ImmA/IrrE family metallo-endopeptidase [Turicibacter sanguinis]MDB8552192.1 ImmA/IrrE family metallo-endopeptidase [Turicibacter sanguinis]